MNKNIRLPKEGLVEPEGGARRITGEAEDVEGHGLPITAPPSFGARRSPGHGGENIPSPMDDEDDVEGHKRR
jgi:hypothetical protein